MSLSLKKMIQKNRSGVGAGFVTEKDIEQQNKDLEEWEQSWYEQLYGRTDKVHDRSVQQKP